MYTILKKKKKNRIQIYIYIYIHVYPLATWGAIGPP